MGWKRISVTRESETRHNLEFRENYPGEIMNRTEFVRVINQDKYPKYHVRKINGMEMSMLAPEGSERNNLY